MYPRLYPLSPGVSILADVIGAVKKNGGAYVRNRKAIVKSNEPPLPRNIMDLLFERHYHNRE